MKILTSYNTQYTQNNKTKIQRSCLSFSGKKEEFGKLLSDVFEKSSEITPEVNKSIVQKFRLALSEILDKKNLMGKGNSASVYKVDDDYVVKILKYDVASEVDTSDLGVSSFEVRNCEKLFGELKTYYGEPLIEIGSTQVLKNTGKHIVVGIDDDLAITFKDIPEITKFYQTHYLPKFAKVSQESYDNLAKDLAILNKIKTKDGRYFKLDSVNPNNIVLANDELKLVDDFDFVSKEDQNSVAMLLGMMLNKVKRFVTVKSFGENTNDARIIFRKIILASEKAGLPYTSIFTDLKILDDVLKNAKIKKTPELFLQKITELRDKKLPIKEHLLEVEKFLDKTVPIE